MEGYLRKIYSLPRNINKLSVWDIDDTLFKSETIRIIILKNNKVVRELTTSEWNSYSLKSGEVADFSQFRDGKFFFHSAMPLSRNLTVAKAALESPSTMMITLSARAKTNNKKMFLEKFKLYGINMNLSTTHSVFAGGLGMQTPKAKAFILDTCLASGKFNSVFMYDDHAENLKEFLNLKNKYVKINFNAYIVGTNGKIKSFE